MSSTNGDAHEEPEAPSVAQAFINAIVKAYPREQAQSKGVHMWPATLPVPDPTDDNNTLALFPQNSPVTTAIQTRYDAIRRPFTPLSLQAQVSARQHFPAADLVMMAPIGLIDLPEARLQETLWLDLHGSEGQFSGGPLLVAGMQGSGKASLLQLILLWFAARYSAKQFRCIVIDPLLDLEVFKALPHFRNAQGDTLWTEGDMLDPVKTLMEYGDQLIADRRRQFPNERWDAQSVPRLQAQGADIPYTLLLIANIHTFEGRRDNAVTLLKDLVLKWYKDRYMGFYSIISSEEIGSRYIPVDLMARIGTRIGFFLNEQQRYDLFGRVHIVPEPYPGRGLVMARDRVVHEMQTALPVNGRTERIRMENLEQAVRWLAQQR